jgi:hypothetical protein
LKLRLAVLISGCIGLWMLVAFPAYYLGGEPGLLFSATAAVLCLVPAAATQLWADKVAGKSPELQLAVVLGGTGIRMVCVIGFGMVLFFGVPVFAAAGFWLWVVGFYLATLTLETILVAGSLTAVDKATGINHPRVG